MKLVELLGERLENWADSTICYVQDSDGNTWPCKILPKFCGGNWGEDNFLDMDDDAPMIFSDACTDHASAMVTKAQWQAERDRQKGGEWKRHRGGAQPKSVSDGEMVEVRLRCGDTQTAYADKFLWNHSDCDESVHITKYRVISQPQAEEVEVKNASMGTLSYTVDIDTGPAMQDLNELSAKWDQVESPFKWRDTVNELEAYIEEFTREREALINRLAEEGFALIPPVVSVMSEFDCVDASDWRSGDIISCTLDYNGQFTKGAEYIIERISKSTDRVNVVSDDKGEPNGWGSEHFKFIRRP